MSETQAEKRQRMIAERMARAVETGSIQNSDYPARIEARSGDLIGDEPEGFQPQETNEPRDPLLDEPLSVDEPFDERAELRARLLQGIPAEIAAEFTEAEIDALIDEERKKALAAKKKEALRDMRERAALEAKVEYDLLPVGDLQSAQEFARANEEVWVVINAPGGGAGEGIVGYRINGFWYQHGHRYRVKRHIAATLQSMHYQAHLHEIMFRTLDQHKPGGSAVEVIGRMEPFMKLEEVIH